MLWFYHQILAVAREGAKAQDSLPLGLASGPFPLGEIEREGTEIWHLAPSPAAGEVVALKGNASAF